MARWPLLTALALVVAALTSIGMTCVPRSAEPDAMASHLECPVPDESRPVPAVECEVLGAVRRAATATAWM
jgi:hypothetical protein